MRVSGLLACSTHALQPCCISQLICPFNERSWLWYATAPNTSFLSARDASSILSVVVLTTDACTARSHAAFNTCMQYCGSVCSIVFLYAAHFTSGLTCNCHKSRCREQLHCKACLCHLHVCNAERAMMTWKRRAISNTMQC